MQVPARAETISCNQTIVSDLKGEREIIHQSKMRKKMYKTTDLWRVNCFAYNIKIPLYISNKYELKKHLDTFI